jgi:hypothetical protein
MKEHTLRNSILLAIGVSLLAGTASAQVGPYQFFAINPCRVVDTRNANSTNGGPALGPNAFRNFAIKGNCGVPTTAKAVSLNVTVANPTAVSWFTIWPSGSSQPVVSTINFTQNDPALANGAIVGVSANSADLSVYNANGTAHVIIDVNGYFQ